MTPSQESMVERQTSTAADLGYGDDIAALNLWHDAYHGWLSIMFGLPSYSLAMARGEAVTVKQADLAAREEAAVLAIQGYVQHARRCARMRPERGRQSTIEGEVGQDAISSCSGAPAASQGLEGVRD